MSDTIGMAVEGALSTLPARNLDLSSFELRWAEALGPPGSAKVADFKTAGAAVGPVWESASSEMRSLLAEYTASSVPGEMSFLDIGTDPKFLSLEKQGNYFIIRPFYESLFQAIAEKWSTYGEDRVLVRGNAGTGKSWFQPFALRRLLQGFGKDHDYLFVFRQVRTKFSLIDLSNAQVRQFKVDDVEAVDCLDLFNHKRVLYFFEPLSDRNILPLPLQLSSLTTLSPFEERTHEYAKSRFVELMFPCWTLEQLSVSAEMDPGIHLELEEVVNRFLRFGGIIRHVFGTTTESYEKTQRNRINDADLTVLRATTTGIDSDPKAPGNNVSGYLLSYCNIQLGGPDRFKKADLDFTSDFVRGRIRERMKDISTNEHIQIVVDHLNSEQTDRGGLHLQETISFLLTKGNDVAWQYKRVGGIADQWSSFRTRARDMEKSYSVSEKLGATDKVLVSTNPNFPLADIVFSQPVPSATILAFQVTWRSTHPFSVRALYMLREIYLKIADTVRIQVFFVTPLKEENYAATPKQSFLEGSVGNDLKYTKRITISSARLERMWQNTEICVLKPQDSWIDTLRPYR